MRFSTLFAAGALGLATLGFGFAAQAAGVTQGASAIPELVSTLPAATYGGEKAGVEQARYYYHRRYYSRHRYSYRRHYGRRYRY